MSIPYDETFEEFERRTGLDAFFSEYSNEVRGKLLSKNLQKPKDIYDVIYPQMREDNLAKNVISKSDLEIDSQIVRESLTKSLVSKQVSLEESGELERKRLESKNKLIQSSKNLEDFAEESRRSASQKNVKISKTIDAIAKSARNENFRSNSTSKASVERDSVQFRESLLSKNVVRDNDPYNPKVEIDSVGLRKNNTKNNIPNTTNLEVDSNSPRELNKSKNLDKKNDLLKDSDSTRNKLIRANEPSTSSLEGDSEEYRNKLDSKNLEQNSNLEIDSTSTRSNLLRNNVPSQSNLELDSLKSKSSNELKNSKSNSDISSESESFRQNILSKNTKSKNNLEDDSKEIRTGILSKNNELKSDLETDSSVFRGKVETKNNVIKTDLDSLSEGFRTNLESTNTSQESDLEGSSKSFRQENVQANVASISNLENDSIELRQDDLSNNNPKPSNLEFKSSVHRNGDLAFNKPKKTDLESDSFEFRDDDLSNNKNKQTNLEFDSESPRQENLSSNNNVETNLEEDSILFRNGDLASNSSNSVNQSDLLGDSDDSRDSNLSSNVPSNSELVGDSFQLLSNSVAKNVPNKSSLEDDSDAFRLNNLFNNVTQPEDLAANSINNRKDNLVSNVKNEKDLGEVSQPQRKVQESSNKSSTKNLKKISGVFRNEQLSKNPSRFSLGTNIILEGTSTFVGVSRLEVSGAIFRGVNKLLNGNGDSFAPTFDDDESIKFLEETSSNQLSPGGREYLMDRNSQESLSPIEGGGNIITTYGTSLIDSTSRIDTGLGFYSSPSSVGFVTNLISLHNIQQNTFQSRPGETYETGVQTAIEGLRNFGSAGFQELISKTGIDKRLQARTNSTPAEVISANGGTYLSSSAEKLIKPQSDDVELGTGISMASQTDTTDKIGFDFDKSGSRKRGVRQIIDTIASDERISFSKNFNVQGEEGSSSVFVVGTEADGKYKQAYSRYSIKNPYAIPGTSESLRFTLTNYSIPAIDGNKMHFPPYIVSFNHGDSATWNSTTFLGRPEPIYTYGNSSRDGSVTFVILTDFAEEVDIGYDFNPQTGEVTKETEGFSSASGGFSKMEAEEQATENNDTAEGQPVNNPIRGGTSGFKERPNLLYSDETNTSDGYTERAEVDTKTKLAKMKRSMLFQPAYFSGSKVDFLQRMEFLSKMTRPARNSLSERTNNGFSFSKPPICHLNLGDWLNHDIVVNSVTYDYSDAPWTLDGSGGRVQPMWCKATLSFNIIGSWGAVGDEDAPLSTDKGGYFSRRTVPATTDSSNLI